MDRGRHTDLDVGPFIVGHTRVGGACKLSVRAESQAEEERPLTKVDTNGTFVNLFRHGDGSI